MSDKPEQQYVYHTDQQVSVNAFLDIDIDGEMFRIQVTSRYGASAEKISNTVKSEVEALRLLRAEYPRTIAEVPTMEPTRVPIGDDGNKLPEVFRGLAGRLSVETKDGKTSFSIADATFQAGRKGSKFGVRVWPEILQGAGLNIDAGQPVPNINGWAFEYVENEKGYPAKVTRLLPPK